MSRRLLPWLLLLVLGVALVTPVATRAESPLVPVLLIHGQGGSSDLTWRTAVEYLEGRGYRQGVSLFALDLAEARVWEPMGLLADAGDVVREIERIRARTGAGQVDLVGHSRGGLVARLAAGGDSARWVRRVVTLNTPHQGALSAGELKVILAAAGLPAKRIPDIAIPSDLEAGSPALVTMFAREQRFADRRMPVLAVATTWREGVPRVLKGHDGAVPVESQLGWPGARTAVFRLGPAAEEISAMLKSDLGAGLLVWNSPHLQSHESPKVLEAVADFLLASRVAAPLRQCEPTCQDYNGLTGYWAEADLRPWFEAGALPYRVAANGLRLFEPQRAMTRAEFVYALARTRGLPELLRPPSFSDMTGHWALGWVEAAVEAGLLGPGSTFEPDRPITRAEAASMLGLWRGDEPLVGADMPLPLGEGALLLVRSLRP